MTTTRESDKAGQGRAITRGEEGRVRALLRDALNVYPSGINLYWSHDDKRMTSVSIDADGQSFRDLTREEVAKAARAGIVPGADGWCWAPSTAVEPTPPPAWLTAAVLASLPPSGVPCSVARIRVQIVVTTAPTEDPPSVGQTERALAHLVGTGKIEAGEQPGTWRRWGVPEGWAWGPMATDHEQTEVLYPIESDDDDVHVARATVRGQWWAALDDSWDALAGQGCATPATLAAAKCAAVRRLWERGVFAPAAQGADPIADVTPVPHFDGPALGETATKYLRDALHAKLRGWEKVGELILLDIARNNIPIGLQHTFGLDDLRAVLATIPGAVNTGRMWGLVPVAAPAPAKSEPAPAPTAEGRPARLRAALLAVLTRGPVHATAALLPALDAAMGERAGVAVARTGEAQQAAREIGARVDGVEWSLPAVPDGWGWWGLAAGDPLYLTPLDTSRPIPNAIATVEREHGTWGWQLVGAPAVSEAESVEEGQDAALRAARLAGLFAAPRASTVTAVDPAPKGPPVVLTAQNGEGVANATVLSPCQCSACRLPAIEHALALATAEIDRQRARADGADPLHRAALAVSAARQRLRAVDPGTDEWSAAEIEVARTTGALLDVLGVEVDGAGPAPLRAGLDAAALSTLDAVGRLREALTALCAGPGQWRWAVDESAPDAAARLLGEMAAAHRDQSHKAADAERSLGFARRDLEVARGALAVARSDLTTAQEAVAREVEAWRKAEARARDAEGRLAAVGAMLEPVLAAIAGGREVGK